MRLFVIDKVERKRIISTVHDKAHFGRDKPLLKLTISTTGQICTKKYVPT